MAQYPAIELAAIERISRLDYRDDDIVPLQTGWVYALYPEDKSPDTTMAAPEAVTGDSGQETREPGSKGNNAAVPATGGKAAKTRSVPRKARAVAPTATRRAKVRSMGPKPGPPLSPPRRRWMPAFWLTLFAAAGLAGLLLARRDELAGDFGVIVQKLLITRQGEVGVTNKMTEEKVGAVQEEPEVIVEAEKRSRDEQKALIQQTTERLDAMNDSLRTEEGTADHGSTDAEKTELPKNDVLTNSLGMIFVKIPGQPFYASQWETRVSDYAAYLKEAGYTWNRPHFLTRSDHPASGVEFRNAREFCRWLTGRERNAGAIPARWEYRLPTDYEWSLLSGINEDESLTPEKRYAVFMANTVSMPVPRAGSASFGNLDNSGKNIADDTFEYVAPVGTFEPERHGLFDLVGNVEEWCGDTYDGRPSGPRFCRGGNFNTRMSIPNALYGGRHKRDGERPEPWTGFRCILDMGSD